MTSRGYAPNLKIYDKQKRSGNYVNELLQVMLDPVRIHQDKFLPTFVQIFNGLSFVPHEYIDRFMAFVKMMSSVAAMGSSNAGDDDEHIDANSDKPGRMVTAWRTEEYTALMWGSYSHSCRDMKASKLIMCIFFGSRFKEIMHEHNTS